jgi:uncharacterized protein YbjT (DUF2867 family)
LLQNATAQSRFAYHIGTVNSVNVIIFGATGMVGQGALRECLLDPDVQKVVAVGRSPLGSQHPKLKEVIRKDLLDPSAIESELTGLDACLFCLGVSGAGMSEENYRRVTYDLTLTIAKTLVRLNPGMTFIYVSGTGTNSSGRMMWARVKGETENALLQLPFHAAYMFRPGYIHPLHGIRTKTTWYRVFYAAMKPIYPVLKLIAPRHLITTEQLGRAMLIAAKRGAPKRVLESTDITLLSASAN